MYLFNITSLPKLNIDGAYFYAKLEVEQGYPDTLYCTLKGVIKGRNPKRP